MTHLLVSLLILVPAPSGDDAPKGQAPMIQFIKFDGSGTYAREVLDKKYINVEKVMPVIENGQQVLRKYTVTEVVATVQKIVIDAKNYDFYDMDGKKLIERDWKRVLADGAIVLIAADSNMPHAAYLKLMNRGALILVPKPTVPAKVSP